MNRSVIARRWLGKRAVIFALLAAGVASGVAAVVFHLLVEMAQLLMIDRAIGLSGPWRPVVLIALPASVAGLLVWTVRRFVPGAEGVGLARLRRAYAGEPDLVSARTTASTLALTPISLGSGAPLGPEGPIVVIASGVSMFVAKLFRLPRKMRRGMIPVGTAAGIAAIFNAPMTGVVFAMEEVLGSAGRGVLGGTIIAAVAGAVVQRVFLGGRPILPASPANWTDVRELVGFAVLGILAGALSAFAIRATLWLRGRLRSHKVSPVAQAVAGGAFVGAIGTFVPSIFSVGYTTTSRFLHGDGDLIFSATALAGKLIAFIAATATGLLGGTFAPSLFLGAALGSTVGGAMQGWLNAETVEPAAYALVGMGAVFGGLLRSPLASALIVFELTGDYALILPLMLAIALSVFISSRLAPRTLTEDQLQREGFEKARSGDPLSALTVSEVMTRTESLIVARSGMSFREVIGVIGAARHREYPVIGEGETLFGVLKSGAIIEAIGRGGLDEPIDQFVVKPSVVARPTQTLLSFLTTMSKQGADRAPVVDSENRLTGFVSPSDVIRARMRVRPEEEELTLLG